MRKAVAAVAVCVAFAVMPPPVSADPFRVTGGSFVIDHEGDFYLLTGDGFSIGTAPFLTGLVVPKSLTGASCFIPFVDEQCRTGETLNISFTTGPDADLGRGDATVGGTAFSDVEFRGSLDFAAAPFTFGTAEPGSFFPVVTPFTFNGLFRGFDNGVEVFSLTLFGSGRVRLPFDLDPELLVFDSEDSRANFDFAPVPEPSTLLLAGAGAAALIRRARRQARRSVSA